MHYIYRVEVTMPDRNRIARAADAVSEHRLFRRRELREIGPDNSVEQMVLHSP